MLYKRTGYFKDIQDTRDFNPFEFVSGGSETQSLSA